MGFQGLKSTMSWVDEKASGTHHKPVLLSKEVLADQGELPMGLIVSEDSDGKVIPFASTVDEVLDDGDGTSTTYTGTLTSAPCRPGSVVVADDTETFSDDGYGVLTGDAGGSGTVNYTSGAVSVTFNAAVTDEEDILADYDTKLVGVLDTWLDSDTANEGYSDVGIVIVHGSYRKEVAKYSLSETDITSAQIALLSDMNIWAE